MEVKPFCVIEGDGNKFWFYELDGYFHKKRTFHREDGPAMEFTNGEKYWYLHDKQYTLEEYVAQMNCSDSEKVEFYLKWK